MIDGLKELVDGVKFYVDSKIKSLSIIKMKIATIKSHSENGYVVKINEIEYTSIPTLNNQSFSKDENVRVLCKQQGSNYIDIIILGKISY